MEHRALSVSRLMVVLALILGLGSGYFAHIVFAADPRFDEAQLAIEKATGLLEAASIAGAPQKCDRPRVRAIQKLARAFALIDKAKTCVDSN